MITKEQLKHLAELAKIEFTEKELEKFLVDLNKILDYIDEIQKLNLLKYEPLRSGILQKLDLRDDEKEEDILDREEREEKIINQFPEKKENYLKVPKIL
ncbi:MAG: Asp-tRNA(Asn)/Glu-tRNA(Gln) amidotransferase subunit GatC [Minisyncoccia bacterium]